MSATIFRLARAPSLVALLALVAPAAWAQPETAAEPTAPAAETLTQSVSRGPLRPGLLHLNQRPPVVFQRWEMRNPDTDEAIDPQAVLTLPDGRQVTAGRYFDELNRLEQGFNALGYSLRDPEPAVRLGQVALVPKLLGGEPELREEVILSPLDGTLTRHRDWSWSAGNPSLFAANLEGSLDLTGSVEMTSLKGVARAGSTAFGVRREILGVTTNVNAPKTGLMTGNFKVSILGTTVYDLPQSISTNWSVRESVSRSVDASTSVHMSLGPIPMTVRAGFQGKAGAQYYFYLNHAAAEAWFKPTVSAKAYAQAGADVVVGGAGAGADMILLNLTLDIYGLASLEQDAQQRPYLHVKAYCLENMTALKGEVYVYVWFYVPEWHGWWLYFNRKEYSEVLWSSPGVTLKDYYYFGEEERLYL